MLTQVQLDELKERSRHMRCHIISMLAAAKSGHPGGSLSSADLLAYLYFYKMNVDPKNPTMPERDRFVLSKGHCAPVLYSALAEKGFFDLSLITSLRKFESILQGHPDMKRTPGVDISSGSLGQGLSVSNGMALAGKLDHKVYRVYVLMGDGELEEGQVWEAAMTSVHYKLDNVTAFVDYNHLQIDGKIEDVKSLTNPAERFRAFGWHVIEVNGNDFTAIDQAVTEAENTKGKPTMVILHTVKGKGVSFMENQAGWHGVAPKPEEAEQALKELGVIPMGDRIATREAYGNALIKLGETNPNVVVLDADLSKSTKTAGFGKKFPERFFQMGIAEADMMATAGGLATTGKIPFASTFAIFATGRAYDQVRNTIGYPGLNVKIAATHAGPTVGEDGGSHQSIEDLTLMRVIPGMTVLNPADAVEAEKLIFAAAEHQGPVYIRLGREPVPVIFDADYQPEIGKAIRLRDGKVATIIATGIMLEKALQAADILSQKGTLVRVINIHTIKPIDSAEIIKAAWDTGAIVTAEEHSVIGGLASAVAEVVVQNHPVPMEFIGMKDRFGQSGSPAELLREYSLTAESIVEAVEKVIGRKNT